LTKGLIKGAIIESGVRDPQDPLCSSLAENYLPLNESLQVGEEFMASLNVTTLAELRELPMEDLESTMGGVSFTATLDGYAMPATYYDTLVQGLAHNVPVITGNTKDESGATYGLNITVDTYLSDFSSTFSSEWLNKFLALYPADNDTAASGAVNSQWTDRSNVGTWLWAQMWLASNVTTAPVYNYYWDHAPPGQDQGAHHESEINYVLNNLYKTNLPWETEDYDIARQMNGYWANFIKTGDPNGEGLTPWDPVNSSQLVQHVGDGWGAVQVAPAAKVELFDEWFATLEKY
jgi:carboxylesterase 2